MKLLEGHKILKEILNKVIQDVKGKWDYLLKQDHNKSWTLWLKIMKPILKPILATVKNLN